MIFKLLRLNRDIEDSAFNELYPARIKILSELHWTPVEVAKIAADYLAEISNTKILDIGSGAGKFCLVGAATTKGMFYGVEQRRSLIKLSKKLATKHNISNVEFIHSNITQISFTEYDAFYFYNPFYENLNTFQQIDKKVIPNKNLYYSYTQYVRKELSKTPLGTRLVTYYSFGDEIPEGFDIEFTAFNGELNFWKKYFDP